MGAPGIDLALVPERGLLAKHVAKQNQNFEPQGQQGTPNNELCKPDFVSHAASGTEAEPQRAGKDAIDEPEDAPKRFRQ